MLLTESVLVLEFQANTCAHLLAVAGALLFEAQLPLQILDDGILGSLNVRIGDGARRLGDRGLLGERFTEEKKQNRTSASEPVTHQRHLGTPR